MNTESRSATLPVLSLVILGLLASGLSAQQTSSPHSIVGRQECASCHKQELAAWEASSHNQKAWSQLDHTKAAEFAAAIGVTNIKGDSACTQCHGTQQMTGGTLKILKGNSCESCHGGAKDWLESHYDFGVGRNVTASTSMAKLMQDRKRESDEHQDARDADCATAGMLRSADAMGIAKNCLSCHLVPNEALQKAGHPMSADFEFVEWSSGEVRHNFLLDSRSNADVPTNWLDSTRNGPGRTVTGRKRLSYLAGLLADLNVSLRIRAKVTSVKRGTLGYQMNDRILDAIDELEDVEVEGLNLALTAVSQISKKTLKKVTAGDAKTYVATANKVAALAEQFLAENASGEQLPATIKIRSKVKGDVYGSK